MTAPELAVDLIQSEFWSFSWPQQLFRVAEPTIRHTLFRTHPKSMCNDEEVKNPSR
jgi:hypothetical protein